MSLLSTGTTALIAFQRALNTTGHNIVNYKTEGYSRQTVSFATRGGTGYSFGQIGNGVNIVDIHRDADALATSRLLDSGGELARLAQLSASANRLDALFSDKATNIAGPWSDFFDAASALAADASSPIQRQQLLDRANALTTRFHQLDREFVQMDEDINARLRTSVDDINRLSSEIAELNGKIGSNAASASPDLLDQRDLLVSQLVELTGGSTVPQGGGQLNVLSAGGHALVVGASASTVTTTSDPYQPGRLHLAMRTRGEEVVMEDKTFGGKIGGMFEFRREVLDPGRAELGRLAVGLAERFNTTHKQGVDLHGKPGEDVFAYAAPRVAAHSGNTGTAALSARYGDLAELSGHHVQLHFDGSAWSARDLKTGASVALTGSGTAGDRLRVGGIELSVEGAAKKGDSFLLQPTSGIAGSLSTAITDPGKIAAASPVKAEAALDNVGKAKVSAISVNDIHHPDLLAPTRIKFTSQSTYTVNGGQEMTWKEGEPIAVNGWQISLDSAPAAGDTFTISKTGPNSSDNRNAKHLADVEAGNMFAGGTLSLKAALSGLTSSIGSAARDAESQTQAQGLLHTQAQNARASVSGVDLNEEGANVLQLQQAYQAAAQLISTADTLFQTMLQATRG